MPAVASLAQITRILFPGYAGAGENGPIPRESCPRAVAAHRCKSPAEPFALLRD